MPNTDPNGFIRLRLTHLFDPEKEAGVNPRFADVLRSYRDRGEEMPRSEMARLADITPREATDVFERFGIPHKDGWGRLPFNSPSVAALLQALKENSCLFVEHVPQVEILPASAKREIEWYVMWSPTTVEYYGDEYDDHHSTLPRANASRVRKGVHVGLYSGAADSWRTCVDEQVREVLLAAGCRGARFAWIQDMGRRPAPQWFLVFPEDCIGTWSPGEWAIRAKLVSSGNDPGVPLAEHPWLELLSRTRHAHIMAPWRVCTSRAPEADVAYFMVDSSHRPSICVSRRIRELLLEKQLASARMFQPLIVDEISTGHHDAPPAPPPVKPGWPVEAVLKETERRYRAFQARMSGVMNTAVDFDKVLGLWHDARRLHPEQIGPAATEAELDKAEHELKSSLPARWRQFLTTAGSGDIWCEDSDLEFEFPVPSQLKSLQSRCKAWFGKRAPKGYLFIGTRASGDMYALDTAHLRPDGDCPVLALSHEGPVVESEWPGIGEFLEDVILTYSVQFDQAAPPEGNDD